jgi:iron complex outermembrane receptor protein
MINSAIKAPMLAPAPRVAAPLTCLLALCFASLAIASPASAQDAPQSASEVDDPLTSGDILVTARKREEKYQDVPVAFQVFSAEQVERYAASNLTQIGEMATQVQIVPTAAGTGASFVVRGISSSNADVSVNSSVALNLDGFQIDRGRMVQSAFFDMEGVEILKGPQVLFYGKNSPAGVVAIHSANPTPEWLFKGKAFYEFNADEFIGEAIASGPLTDTLGIRFAYRGNTSKGWLKNVAKPQASPVPLEPYVFPGALDNRLGGRKGHLGRLTLEYKPTTDFTANLKLSANRENLDAASLRELIACSGPLPRSRGFTDPDGDCTLNGVTSAGAYAREIQQAFPLLENRDDGGFVARFRGYLGVLNLDYNTGPLSISSVTAAHKYSWFQFDDFDGTVWNFAGGDQREKYRQISQELRVLSNFDSQLNFMLGGYYGYGRFDTENNCKIAPVGLDPATGQSNSCSLISRKKDTSLSAFGQLIWKPVEGIELTAGGRLSHEKTVGRIGYTYVHSLLTALFRSAGLPPLHPRITDTNFSPEVTALWKVTNDVSVYAAYKTGYKAGGYTAVAIISPSATDDSILYRPEKAKGGEIGLKAALDGGRLRVNMTAYKYNFDDGQDAVFVAPTTSFEVRNSDSKSTGIEFDVTYQVVPELRLNAQLGYNEAKYRKYLNAPCWSGELPSEGCIGGVQDLTGRPRPLAPKWDSAAGFDYQTAVGDAYRFGLSLNGHYRSGHHTQAALNPGGYQHGVFTANGSVRFGAANDRWEVAFIVQNLTNKRYFGNSLDQPGGTRGDVIADAIRPRQVALQTTVQF